MEFINEFGGNNAMDLYVNVKSIGRRKNALDKVPYTLPNNITVLSELITEIVNIEIGRYNAKEKEATILPYLTEPEIENHTISGKVGFGSIYSDKKENVGKAVEVALQGFEDGLFRVTVNGEEVKELNSPVALKDGDILSFIRLTFLAGSLWNA